MSRDEQIGEMAGGFDACPYIAAPIGADKHEGSLRIAEYFYNKGYRKASEVAREIFEEIEDAFSKMNVIRLRVFPYGSLDIIHGTIAELKKKYTEDWE